MAVINWSNVTGLEQLPGAANTASDGFFWPGMLQMIWIILLILSIGIGLEIALLFSSFIALIFALFLFYAGLSGWLYVVQFSSIILVLMLYIIYSSGKK